MERKKEEITISGVMRYTLSYFMSGDGFNTVSDFKTHVGYPAFSWIPHSMSCFGVVN
jgi:hypothetical protein